MGETITNLCVVNLAVRTDSSILLEHCSSSYNSRLLHCSVYHPIHVENSAWIGPYRLAQFLRRILSERDKIQTEIVELS